VTGSRLKAIEAARLEWAADGTPRSSNYDDVYHSTEGGLEQTRHVFLAGCGLPEAWRERRKFTVLETGFGLGLNFLATWQAWREDTRRCERLHFVSTELHPFSRADLASLHAHWPELDELATQLQTAWPPLTSGFHHLVLDDGRVMLTLLFGDADETLKQFSGSVDAIFLDGFAPQKNPQLWSPALLKAITRHAAPGATLASWCVAGPVRTALQELGWAVAKRPGYAHKWQMLTASRRDRPAPCTPPSRAIVVGAGVAGCSVTEALARRGWRISLIERNPEPAQEASGNPAGLLHPMLARDDNLAARFSRAAYLYGLRLLKRLGHENLPWQACGILQIAEDDKDAAAQRASCAHFPADYASWLDRRSASLCAGLEVGHGGWWFPHGAWVSPPALCRALLALAAPNTTTHYNTAVAAVRHEDGRWHALDAHGHRIAEAEHLILANAAAAQALTPDLSLTLRTIRGQLSYLPPATLRGLKVALCGAGYAIRTDDVALVGASFIEDDTDMSIRSEEHADNLRKLASLLPELPNAAAVDTLPGRVSFRAASRDRMPLVGALPRAKLREQDTLADLPRQQGLHALLGLGARGLSWGPLAGELLAAQLDGDCLPLETALVRMLDPARHQLRKTRTQSD
jgi:tRNA 5-methylaminomethyl-2-thiouridine biosynthesis bifunctional protein